MVSPKTTEEQLGRQIASSWKAAQPVRHSRGFIEARVLTVCGQRSRSPLLLVLGERRFGGEVEVNRRGCQVVVPEKALKCRE